MTPGSYHHRRIDMPTPLLIHPVARRAAWAAILAALVIVVMTLFALGSRPAPAAPILGRDAVPAVHQAAPGSSVGQPGAALSVTGASVETRSPADPPIGMVEPDRTTISAGGVSGGVLGDRHRGGIAGN
jgi:hypothetical protein